MVTPEDDLRHRDLPRDSYYWNVLLPDEEVMALFYTVLTPDPGKSDVAGIIIRPGEETLLDYTLDATREGEDSDDVRVGPLHLRVIEPMRVHEVTYDSEALGLEYRFEALDDVFDYNRNPNGAPPPMGVNRIEQAGRITGTLRLGDREIPFDTTGERDHSWGPRGWGLMHHYKWFAGQAGSDLAFNAMVTFYRDERLINGWVYRDGRTVGLTDVEAKVTFKDDMKPAGFVLELLDEERETTTVRSTDLVTDEIAPWGAQQTEFSESLFRCDVNGQPGKVVAELLWQAGYLDALRNSPLEHTREIPSGARG